jgi:N-acetyl-D-muramate 6-phosphate phosphatase
MAYTDNESHERIFPERRGAPASLPGAPLQPTETAVKITPQCVLFDLDGTLVDTAPDLGLAANLVREELNLPPLPMADYRASASGGARGLLKVALGICPEDEGYAQRKQRFLVHYRANLSNGSSLFAGVAEMLESLDCAGIRWGVVTNKVSEFSKPLLNDLGLDRRCACIVSGDSTPKPKPAPDPLLLASQQIGVLARDCVYVGDDERDILAGRAARMRTIAAGWGYMGDKPDPRDWAADVIVKTPSDLVSLLELKRAA